MAWSIEASLAGAKASALARAARMKGKNPLKALRSAVNPQGYKARRMKAVLKQLEQRHTRFMKKAQLYGPKHRLGVKNAKMAELANQKLEHFKKSNPAYFITNGGR